MTNSHEICVFCGHYYFLHLIGDSVECEACDSPAVPIDKKCPGWNEVNKK